MSTVKCQFGFTLIELLVVVFIIGLLAATITVSGSAARAQGRDARRQADLQTVAAALELYRSAVKRYPTVSTWADLKPELFPTYLKSWPADPRAGASSVVYAYSYTTNRDSGGAGSLGAPGAFYALEARLEQSLPATLGLSDINLTDPSAARYFVTGIFAGSDGSSFYRVSGP